MSKGAGNMGVGRCTRKCQHLPLEIRCSVPTGMPAEMWCIIKLDWWSKVSRRYQASITELLL